jgi:predicted ATPase/class 3 adenylate cyclase
MTAARETSSRRLAAILAADIAGYSALMGADEARTVRDLKGHQAVVLPIIGEFGGRIIDTAGDGILAEFPSVVNGVECAVAIQSTMAERNAGTEPERRMQFRIGINIGDVIYDEARIYGDGINIAARLEAIAEPGGICISGKVYDEVSDRIDLIYEDMGEQQLKNIARPVRAYRLATGDAVSARPFRAEATAVPPNLPIPATSFFGREKAIAEIAALLQTERLVTLTGVGGVGKTRLAIRVASEISANYCDGVWFAELAAISAPGAAAHAVAAVLGVAQQSGKTIEQSVLSSLRHREMLLVLDNCEHLVDAIASLAQNIIASCPKVTLLVTSREALTVDGERTWAVPSLDFASGVGSPAVELFVERARAVTPDFTLGCAELAVVEICRQLDGIPLAIELAAARTRVMSAQQIRDRLNDRFRLLTGGSRRKLERHQTLRQAMQWSYDLLTPSERTIIARVSVFASGFALEGAEHICTGGEIAASDVLDLLDSLARKSLITVGRANDIVRYGMLETIRQFAAEQLAVTGESETIRSRHAELFADDSDAHFRLWLSSNQLAAYEWLDHEMDNLRAAFRWASEHAQIDVAARIASNIGDMARFRMREEAAHWAAEIVDAARAARHPRLAVLLTWAASSAWSFGRLEEAKGYGAEAISLVDDARFDPFVWAFADLAQIAFFEGHSEQAIELVRAGAGQDADRSDRFCLAMLLHFTVAGGRCEEAMKIAAEILPQVEAAGVPSSITVALWAKGEAFADANPSLALHAYERGLALARQSGNRFWEIVMIPKIGALQARSGDPVGALRSFQEMLEFWRQSSDLYLVSHGVGSLMALFDRLGYATEAATLNGVLAKMFASDSSTVKQPGVMARVRTSLGDASFEAASREGAQMTPREAMAYAAAQIQQALASLGSGEPIKPSHTAKMPFHGR